MKKRTAGPCIDGQGHVYTLTAAYDDLRRRGDEGTCQRCGATKFWLWPSEQGRKWRAQSILPKKVA